MKIQTKDAVITNTGDEFPGSFEVILSAPTKDRDGDTLTPETWKQPLPEHITFDSDHGMSVASTVGSGVPRIDEQTGNLIVAGTYSSLPRAQEVRTLVNEGHIRTTSVAFMTEPSTEKDGTPGPKVRELLNGAFVAIPSNREALVLSSKSAVPSPAEVFGKAGSRNSKADAAHIQAIHDHALALGAKPAGPEDSSGAEQGATGGKSVGTVYVDVVPRIVKAAGEDDPGALAQGVDAALDQALDLLSGVDLTTLPEPVRQAIALLTAAEETSDELQDALGVPDPDDTESATEAPAQEKAADDSDVELKNRVIQALVSVHED